MSGVTGVNQQLNLLPVTIDTVPRAQEGSKACYVSIPWQSVHALQAGGGTTQPVALLNLLQQYQTGQFTTVQAAYIDNSTCPYTVTFLCLETSHSFTVPAFSQGMYPVFCGQAPFFSATLNAFFDVYSAQQIFPCTTKVFFFNTPQRYYEQTNLPVFATQAGITGTLVSATPSAIPGLASIFPLSWVIYSIQLTINISTAFTAGTRCQLFLQEGGNSGPWRRWQDEFWAPGGATGTSYQHNMVFPNPLVQIDQSNGYFIGSSNIVAPAVVGFTVFLNVGEVLIA